MNQMSIDLPKIPLLDAPTPLQKLERLTQYLDGPQIFLKRDDLGPSGGGNKIRKFERQFAEAKSKGADTLILAAHSQSNCARELVGAAAMHGLETVIVTKNLVNRNDANYQANGNALLMDLMGTTFREIDNSADFMAEMQAIARELELRGRTPYILPFGASDALGVSGYVDSGREIFAQCSAAGITPDAIVVATGSCGTQAGLVIAAQEQAAKTRVQGFTILHDAPVAADHVTRLVAETTGTAPTEADIHIDQRARGEGYGAPTREGIDAIRLLARVEGVFLDPVYTGKAMAGFLDWLPESGLSKQDSVVFVHTGGMPLLFAYAGIFQ